MPRVASVVGAVVVPVVRVLEDPVLVALVALVVVVVFAEVVLVVVPVEDVLVEVLVLLAGVVERGALEVVREPSTGVALPVSSVRKTRPRSST